MLKINTRYLESFLNENEITNMKAQAKVANETLLNGTGAGNEFLGWVNLPDNYDREEFSRIKSAASKINKQSDVLLVIGIGGSYLGSKAVIDFLNNQFYNSQNKEDRSGAEIYFVGNNISSSYMHDLEGILKDKDFSINVISKSGTTTEPAIAFRHFKNILVNKYGKDEANTRIYATTDKENGALKMQVDANGWESFVVPDGRFSVLTAVGLLPIAVTGADITSLIEGASKARNDILNSSIEDNQAVKYALIRNILYAKGFNNEILVAYEPSLQYFNEWWKQLFGESEGKDGKGLFPSSVVFSTDLHSLGQFIQDGSKISFETVIAIKNVRHEIIINKEQVDGDGLNYLAGETVSYVNDKAFEATALAHVSGGVPNICLELEDMSALSIGYMIYFFEYACAVSGYMLGVNPFDQPGVEEYKKNMFALLKKPGFEELREKLTQK